MRFYEFATTKPRKPKKPRKPLTPGRGRWMDNIFIERLWRSLKYECVYLNDFETGSDLRKGVGRWFDYYTNHRPHSTLAGRTPTEAYGQIDFSDQVGHAPPDLKTKLAA